MSLSVRGAARQEFRCEITQMNLNLFFCFQWMFKKARRSTQCCQKVSIALLGVVMGWSWSGHGVVIDGGQGVVIDGGHGVVIGGGHGVVIGLRPFDNDLQSG
jgi:hypothetical protein